MEAFRAVNFAVFPHRGVLGSEESRKSMEEMVRRIYVELGDIHHHRGCRNTFVWRKSVMMWRKAVRMRNCMI